MELMTSALLPTALAPSPVQLGFGYAGSCLSALDVGGDFYDVVPLPDRSLLLVIADVMGKGHAASLFAGTLRTLVRALAQPGINPAACLRELNALMFEELSGADLFITMQLAVADLQRRRLQVANAGHCPILLSTPTAGTQTIAPDGIPLGIDRDAEFCEETATLAAGSSLLLYTDGITEARNQAGLLFGQERLENWLRRALAQPCTAVQLKSALLGEITAFQGHACPQDDQTFLVLADEAPLSILSAPVTELSRILPAEVLQETVALNPITVVTA